MVVYPYEIVSRNPYRRGFLYSVLLSGTIINLRFTDHVIERMAQWNCTEKQVLETLLFPEEVVIGHRGRFIAHRRYGAHIIRAVYEYEGNLPVLVTVYFPYAERYFQGGGFYADRIFSGS